MRWTRSVEHKPCFASLSSLLLARTVVEFLENKSQTTLATLEYLWLRVLKDLAVLTYMLMDRLNRSTWIWKQLFR